MDSPSRDSSAYLSSTPLRALPSALPPTGPRSTRSRSTRIAAAAASSPIAAASAVGAASGGGCGGGGSIGGSAATPSRGIAGTVADTIVAVAGGVTIAAFDAAVTDRDAAFRARDAAFAARDAARVERDIAQAAADAAEAEAARASATAAAAVADAARGIAAASVAGRASVAIRATRDALAGVREEVARAAADFGAWTDAAAAALCGAAEAAARVRAQGAAELLDAVVERRRLGVRLAELRGAIRVVARVRPCLPGGAGGGEDEGPPIVTAVTARGVVLVGGGFAAESEKAGAGGTPRALEAKSFEMDGALGPTANGEEVFDDVAPLVDAAIAGAHACVFAYGQTGSGKTHTMDEVVSRAIKRATQTAPVRIAIVQVYNEAVMDLLSSPAATGGVEGGAAAGSVDCSGGSAFPGASIIPSAVRSTPGVDATVFTAATYAAANAIVRRGAAARSVSATASNERSSRSHLLIFVDIEGGGRLVLVDLAGSERVRKSGAEGARLKEAQAINKSLSALGDVFAALAASAPHIPFRNSTLTHLLADSLGREGGKALMLVCVGPGAASRGETLCALTFASRVRRVELGRTRFNTCVGSSGAVDADAAAAVAANAAAVLAAGERERAAIARAVDAEARLAAATASALAASAAAGSSAALSEGYAAARKKIAALEAALERADARARAEVTLAVNAARIAWDRERVRSRVGGGGAQPVAGGSRAVSRGGAARSGVGGGSGQAAGGGRPTEGGSVGPGTAASRVAHRSVSAATPNSAAATTSQRQSDASVAVVVAVETTAASNSAPLPAPPSSSPPPPSPLPAAATPAGASSLNDSEVTVSATPVAAREAATPLGFLVGANGSPLVGTDTDATPPPFGNVGLDDSRATQLPSASSEREPGGGDDESLAFSPLYHGVTGDADVTVATDAALLDASQASARTGILDEGGSASFLSARSADDVEKWEGGASACSAVSSASPQTAPLLTPADALCVDDLVQGCADESPSAAAPAALQSPALISHALRLVAAAPTPGAPPPPRTNFTENGGSAENGGSTAPTSCAAISTAFDADVSGASALSGSATVAIFGGSRERARAAGLPSPKPLGILKKKRRSASAQRVPVDETDYGTEGAGACAGASEGGDAVVPPRKAPRKAVAIISPPGHVAESENLDCDRAGRAGLVLNAALAPAPLGARSSNPKTVSVVASSAISGVKRAAFCGDATGSACTNGGGGVKRVKSST